MAFAFSEEKLALLKLVIRFQCNKLKNHENELNSFRLQLLSCFSFTWGRIVPP
jgi:hypothetical protein